MPRHPPLYMRHARYIHVPAVNTAVCVVQRAGSTSMNVALMPRGKPRLATTVHQAAALQLKSDGATMVLWVRNWKDRFTSIWRLFDHTPSAEQFLNNTLRHDPNFHWTPQTELHSADGILIPTVIHKFDDLNTTWGSHFPDTELGKLRVGPETPWSLIEDRFTPDQLQEITDYYAADQVLYDAT